MHAGQEARRGTGMIAGSVTERLAVLVHQSAENEEIVFERRAAPGSAESNPAPSAEGIQLDMSTPLGTYMNAIRTVDTLDAVLPAAANAGRMASSAGSATAAPRPRRNAAA